MTKILAVDDEALVAKALGRLLRGEGFEVEIAFEPLAALDILARFQPDVVISDYLMPNMNGMAFIQEIRRRSPKTACLLLSGFANLDPASFAIDVPFLRKPWDRESLLAAIETARASVLEKK